MRRVLTLLVLLAMNGATAEAGKFNRVLDVGAPAPAWSKLPGVDGKDHALSDLKKSPAVLVLFLSNRCPMTRAYETRLIRLTAGFRARGLRVVAINVSRSPLDRFEKMQQRARDSRYNFLYLRDDTQKIGRRYGATCTPQVFLLDRRRRVAYMGAIDDNADESKVEFHYLRDAIGAVLAGKSPEVTETLQKGCEIKYAGGEAR